MRTLLVRGAMWVTLTRILLNLISFISTALLARLLLPSDFGLVAIASALIAVVMAVSELSLSQALIQCRDPVDEHFDTAFTLNLIRAIILAALIALMAFPLARIYGDPRLLPIMLVSASGAVIAGIVSPRLVTFQRQLQFKQDFILQFAMKLIGFIFAISVAVIWRSYWSLVIGSTATEVSAALISFWLAPYRPRLSLSRAKELLSFSIWLTLNFAMRTFNWRMDSLLIGYALGAKSAGVYSMADNLAGLPTREGMAPISQTLFPAFSRMADDIMRLRAAYQRACAILCAVAFPLGIGFAVIAQPFIVLVLSEKWASAAPLIEVLSIMIALQTAGWPMLSLGSALGQTRAVFNCEALSFLVRLPFMILGLIVGLHTSVGGLMGVVCGRVIATAIGTLFNMILIRRLISVPILTQFLGFSRSLLACAIMACVVLLVRAQFAVNATDLALAMEIALSIVAGAMSYIAAMLVIWLLQGRPDGPESAAIALISKSVPSIMRISNKNSRTL